jgi:hypothetical protein
MAWQEIRPWFLQLQIIDGAIVFSAQLREINSNLRHTAVSREGSKDLDDTAEAMIDQTVRR